VKTGRITSQREQPGGDRVTTSDERPVLLVPTREIPVPSHLSPAARAVLSMGPLGDSAFPALDDAEAWRAMARERDAVVGAMMEPREAAFQGTVEELDCEGRAIFVVTPDEARDDDPRVYLEFHGGGLTMGGGRVCRAMAMGSATNTGRRTFSVDYRMPPDHPYPAALDDGIAAYRLLLEDHDAGEIIVGGGSAGANIAAAVILRARDEGLPLPAAAFLATPEVDLTESGDSFATNLGIDTVLTASLMPANLLYANGHDLADPYLSPLFADFTKGFPPTFLQTGTRDLFLSNTVRMHRALRAAGISAELHVIEAGPHGGFFGSAPEDAEVVHELRRFFAEH
jgi:acetyl esterase/lipase